MVSRRSSSAVKRRSVVARQDDTHKARKLRLIADPNGITVPAKIVRVKKGRKKEKAHMLPMDDCSMELDEAHSAHYVPVSVGSSVGSSERIPELPRNVSLSTMSDAHHFGIHGGEIVSAGGDIHINKYSPPNAERSVDRVPTTSSLPTVSESEIQVYRNTAQGASGSITDLQFPNVIQTLSSYLQGIRRHLIPSRTTVDDIMHSPIFLVDFPTAMIPEDTQTYSRFMLQFRQGYPLYRSTPIRGVSETHWKKGVRIGDVGRVRPDGSFEFLFNINPNETDTRLPDGFEKLHHVDSFQEPDYYSRGEHLLKGSVDQTRNSPITYKFSASGAILQLPEGATHFEAQNKNDFSTLASRYAQRWYEYMNVDRSMGVPNGSLYLITGCIKCTSCATAVFSEPHVGENWLEFHHEGLRARPRYMWKRMGPMTARVNQNQEDLGVIDVEEPRHCVFIRGFKITLGDKQWNQLIKIAVTQHSSQDRFVEASGSSGASWSANHATKDGCDISRQYTSSDSGSDNNGDTECSPIIQQLSSSTSPMHPSDFINAILLQRNPEAKVAVTHDDDWLGLFPEDHSVDPFSFPVDTLLKILDEAYSTVDEHGCVSLVKTTQQEPAQGSTNMKTAITRSDGKGRRVSSALDVRQSDGRDLTYKPPPYIVKMNDLPGPSCASLVPYSVSPPPVASSWQVVAKEHSPPTTTEASTTFDHPMPVPKDTALGYTEEPGPPNDPEYNAISNRSTPVPRLTPAAVSSHSTPGKPSTQDTSFGPDSSLLSSLPSSQISPLSLPPLRKTEEKRKYEKRLRDEGGEIESDNPKLKRTYKTAQGLRNKDKKRIEQHTTAEEKKGRQTMIPGLAFPPPSSAAVGDGDQNYFGGVVRGLIKTEDEQKDVVEASLPPKKSKEEEDYYASQVVVQDLLSMIPSVLGSTSLSHITPQHFGQDQHEAGSVKLETESILLMDQSLTDFGPSHNYSSRQLQSRGSNDLKPFLSGGDNGAAYFLESSSADVWPKWSEPSTTKDYRLQEGSITYSASRPLSPQTADGNKSQQPYSELVVTSVDDDPFLSPPSCSPLPVVTPRRLLDMMGTRDLDLPPSHSSSESDNDQAGENEDPSSSKLEAETPRRKGPRIVSAKELARIQRRKALEREKELKRLMAILKASVLTAPATEPKKSGRSFTIRAPPTKTTWECGPDYTTCHHCRRRTYRLKMMCKCGKSWCNACILTNYDNLPFDVNMRDWDCPCCQNACRCDVCTKKRGETYISKRNLGAAGISPRKKRVFIGRIQPCWGHDMVHKSKVRRLQEGSEDDTVKRLIRDDGEKRKNPRFKKRVYIGNPDVFLELGMKDKFSDSAAHDMVVAAMDSVASSVLNVVNTKLESLSDWSLTDIKQEFIESKFFQSSILPTQQ